jgi:2-succinyl-5-enolpyruvyl-6-hydroxy-3-cyclohexene-1-carboxylate synthase
MTHDANTCFARCLVDEWSRGGLTDAVLSPGSRSTPLALALAEHDHISLHVHIDERSAAFFALGLAKATGRPAVVLCTSGTAAANFHPAVLEAFHARVPMIVCTADRPPELREVGEAQTVNQARLYGTATRWYFEPDAPREGFQGPTQWATWRSLAARALAEALGPPAGPVHINVPFREPLVPSTESRPPFDLGGRPEGRPWLRAPRSRRLADAETVDELASRISGVRRGILVAGWGGDVSAGSLQRLARAARWPILADPLSGMRAGPFAISTYDTLSRIDDIKTRLKPEMVLRLGAPLTSKHAMAWLGASASVMIDPDHSWADSQRAADTVLDAEPGPLLDAVAGLVASKDDSWLSEWIHAEKAARDAIDAKLDSWSEPFEGRVARDVIACLPDGSCLVVASSMPVRDLETFAAPRSGVSVVSNRGVNGIDGFVSTALGVAASRAWPGTVALVGDLCLLHDSNGLLGAKRRQIDAVFVVIDNNGGGIFSFLPQAASPTHFEELFGTPHDVDIGVLSALHGLPVIDVRHAAELVPTVEDAIAAGGVRIVRVRTQRADNVQRHDLVFKAVADALSR